MTTTRKDWLVSLAVSALLVWAVPATGLDQDSHEGHDHSGSPESSSHEELTNTTCPVMGGNDVKQDIFSVYQGKKVYFCCPSCKVAFEANPQKYLAGLPQFAQIMPGDLPGAGHDHNHEPSGGGISLIRLIKPAGIVTLTLVLSTVGLALLRRKNPKLMPWHMRLGKITALCAIVHAVLVLLAH